MNGKRPNILLITTDTQRCDTLKCMGSPFAVSPCLDRMASEGVLFTQAHTASPVCMPARCSLMTGLHAPIHGCTENGIARRDDVPVLTDFLKEQGYYNIMVGKTHFGPMPQSFDVVHIAHEKNGDDDDDYGRHVRSHGYKRESSHPNHIPEELFMDAFLADSTISEIENAVNENKGPFFAFCSMVSPHSPIDPPGKWAHLYDDVELPPLNYKDGEEDNYPEHLRRLVGKLTDKERRSVSSRLEKYSDTHCGVKEFGRKRIDELRKLYYGLAAYCDAQVGRLLDYLDRSGLRENTLVIFTSDHGQEYFDHGFNNKHNFYDSSWRIPLIMSMLGTLPEGETREFAVWTDITATILAAANTGCDAIQGFDLFNPLKDRQPSPRKCAVGTLYMSAAVASRRWKLEYDFHDGTGMLFDRTGDPMEQNNLFQNQSYSGIKDAMLKALLEWRAGLSDLWHLKNHRHGGGPVAQRLAMHTNTVLKGTDAEERLNEACERIDGLPL